MTDRFGGVYQGNIDYEGSKRMDRPCMHGKGTFKWRDGRLFEGNFNFCCPVEGILTEPNGKKYIVKFDGSTKIEHDPALVDSRMVPTQKILEGNPNIPIPTRNQLEVEARTELEVLEREAIAETEDKKFQIKLQAVKDGAEPCILPLDIILKWTANFSSDRKIGSGSFGEVYEVQCPGVGRLAVKRLHPSIQLHGTDEDRSAALMCARREVNVLGSFRHPNIIRLLGYTETRGQASAPPMPSLCLVYELAARGGLDSNLRSDERAAELTWKVRLRIAAGVARALNYLHCHDARGPAFHRDVKSGNVTLTAEMSPKLIDCGLARHVQASGPAGTVASASGARFGTPGYKCPAYERSGDYQAKSEVFSFGVVLLELVTGRVQADGHDLYGLHIEDEQGLAAVADPRAGAWSAACAEELEGLARACLERHGRRLAAMGLVVRRLAALEERFAPMSGGEERMARAAERLRGELEALRASAATAGAERGSDEGAVCGVCFETAAGGEAVACPRRGAAHALCRACFGHEALAQLSAEAAASFAASGGRLVCRQCLPDRAPYSDGAAARGMGDALFALYRHAAEESAANLACREQAAHFQRQLAILRLQARNSPGAEKVRVHAAHIMEELLNDRCPRYSEYLGVFLDVFYSGERLRGKAFL